MINVTTLDNGLQIITEDIPFVRSISFGIWVKNGSRNEPENVNGISHFIEHMLFKGTDKRSSKEIADTMDEIGGQVNAYTSKEYTCYYTRTLDSHFDLGLDVLADMFFNSRLEESDIDKERGVILEELSMYEDTPEDLVHDLLQSGVYGGSALGRPILGSPETISGIKKSDMREYLNSKYTPANTIVAIAGNLKGAGDILAKLRETFAAFPAAAIKQPEPQSYKPAFVNREKDIEQLHLCVGFPGIAMGTDESYTMAVINTLFGGGMSSRLFQKIREERGLAYAVYSYPALFVDTGLFAVYAGTSPSSAPEVLELILEEARLLTKEAPAELAKTKEQLKTSYILGLENVANRMNSIGRNLLMVDQIVTEDQLIAKIDAVTEDEFLRLCRQVFDIDRMSLALVGKVEGVGGLGVNRNSALSL